jgi:hypothetical protein
LICVELTHQDARAAVPGRTHPSPALPVNPTAFVCKTLFGALGKRNGRIRAGFCCAAVILGHIDPLFSTIQPLFCLFGATFVCSARASAAAN